MAFLLDWEVTMKCNLDCSYCGQDLYGGHDNSTEHPKLDECMKTVEFMFEYVDLYMKIKPKGLQHVILNVYGGESLHHPDIVKIFEHIEKVYQSYKDRWYLTVTTTTNAIITRKKLEKIIPYVHEFTCSYHSESKEKQQEQFKENVLLIKNSGRRLKCIVMMHNDPDLFEDSKRFITWCQDNGIRYFAKTVDNLSEQDKWKYGPQQVKWINSVYQKTDYKPKFSITETTEISKQGRTCCGGRHLCMNNQRSEKIIFSPNKFVDWYCSVNEFFLHIKQITKEIFANKDCKMNFDGSVSPIGSLDSPEDLLNSLRESIGSKQLPYMICKKAQCLCGLCAPKAKDLTVFNSTMEKYRI